MEAGSRYAALLSLQRAAGNRAVAELLSPGRGAVRSADSAVSQMVVAQRRKGHRSTKHAAAAEPRVSSSDPRINGRTVAEVGAELQGRTSSYLKGVNSLKRNSEKSQREEAAWYRDLDLAGRFIDLFNSQPRTDPARWEAIAAQWEGVRIELDAAHQAPVTPAGINEAGRRSQLAIENFKRVYQRDQRMREQFSSYLQGFSQSAEGVGTTATIVRDISFAAAVGIAVVAAAPTVLIGATKVAGGVGLTGASATLAAYGGTALTMGGVGAGIEGAGQAGSALLYEGTGLINDLLVEGRTWAEAVDRFRWTNVGTNGWQGMKRGFVDGVLAYAAMGFDKVLTKAGKVALTRVLGQEGASTLAKLLRQALTRAISGGASGSVIGALDAGIKAAMEHETLGEIESAMEQGFAVGALMGTVLGGAGGAFDARTRARLTAEISELQKLLVSNPKEFARRYRILVEGLTPQQRANWDTELSGRRFVDRVHYEPAKSAYEAGASPTPPQHRYGADQFRDWGEAAATLDAHARTGKPLTEAQVEKAHAAAARRLTPEAGKLRGAESTDLRAGGRLGLDRMWSALTPEQLAVLERNPHIRLVAKGALNEALTAAEIAQRMETAIIKYPDGGTVQSKLEQFFRWYAQRSRTMDPSALAAAAQREFVSIHPFLDGNGRVSRLVMDHALQRRGLPPSLLENPNLDYMVTESAWVEEVRKGVIAGYQLTLRHVNVFNAALRAGEPSRVASVWGSILGMTNAPEKLIRWLYHDDLVPAGPR